MANAFTGLPEHEAHPGTSGPCHQLVAGAAATGLGFLQHIARQQFGDVAQGGVLRALGNRRPLAAGEFAIKAID